MTTNSRALAQDILSAGLRAVDPAEAVRRYVHLSGATLRIGERSYDTAAIAHIYVVGTGKASAAMGQAIEQILGDRISGGWINTKYGHTIAGAARRITVHEAGHPVPDENGVSGTRE